MSETYIGAELRRLVVSRARRRCEYCLVFEDDTYVGFQIDHVISEKHGGPTAADNLALACLFCNLNKGSDIGSLDEAGSFTRLFHPRQDRWDEHFRFEGPRIEGVTRIGVATARLLRFNDESRVQERRATMSL
ncbi:MAG TPA: HNH endonuclease [Verrucomicrobiales bacterium]|nr:HNH endonuclease [Verrucomicrobiales bacterium]